MREGLTRACLQGLFSLVIAAGSIGPALAARPPSTPVSPAVTAEDSAEDSPADSTEDTAGDSAPAEAESTPDESASDGSTPDESASDSTSAVNEGDDAAPDESDATTSPPADALPATTAAPAPDDAARSPAGKEAATTASTATSVADSEDVLPDPGAKATKAARDAAAKAPPHRRHTARPADAETPADQPAASQNTHQASAIALPAGSGALDSATVQRIVDRLVQLHLLNAASEAQDPELFTQAIKAFQASAGISQSGTLDRDTIGRLATQ